MSKQLKQLIQSDFKRYYNGGGYHFMWSLLNHGLKCIVTYRKANYYSKHNKLLYLYYTFRLKVLDKKYAFHIPAKTEIGEGFFIGHNGPIIINTKAKIGRNCNIATGVTIGRENRGKREGAPHDRRQSVDRDKCRGGWQCNDRRQRAYRAQYICQLRCAGQQHRHRQPGQNYPQPPRRHRGVLS